MKACAGGSFDSGIARGGRLPILRAIDIGVSGHSAFSASGLTTGMSRAGWVDAATAISSRLERSMNQSPFSRRFITIGLDGEAFAAAAGAGRVGIVEHEAGRKIVLAPVHHRADQIEDRAAVDVEGAAGRRNLLVERVFLRHIVDRISEARAAAPGGRQFDPDGAPWGFAHQLGDTVLRRAGQRDRGRPRAELRFLVHSIPNSSLASSLIFDGSHGGSQTRLTTASRMPGTDSTRSSTSFGSDSATGQCGVVSVMVMVASQ